MSIFTLFRSKSRSLGAGSIGLHWKTPAGKHHRMASPLTNQQLDELLMRELPGYQSVLVSRPEALLTAAFFGWRKEGVFTGWPRLEWHGPRDYQFKQYPEDEFYFARQSKEKITPDAMNTDGGSIPRLAWIIPGLSPWDYLPAYIVHDWEFLAHHRKLTNKTFEEVNLTLAEGIYTLWQAGLAHSDFVRIEIIYQAVSSPIGRKLWDHPGQ